MKLHDYQEYAVKFIEEHKIAALLLDMGLGKTITTLTAINNLIYDLFEVRKVLIIAPLRVARDTWSAEVQKWNHLKHLRYSVAVGTAEERIAALKADADIYVINRENVDWLVSNTTFDYDMIVIDELSSFKNHQTNGETNRRIDRHSCKQRTYGLICGVPSAGYGRTLGKIYRAIQKRILQA